MRIGIIVDSCCDLPRQFLDEHEIVVLPISLRIGGAVIQDRRDPDETHRFYATHVDRRSEDFAESFPYSPAQIEQVFLDKMVIDYDYVFVLTITSERSPIYDHAMQASRTVLTKYKDPRREIGKPGRFGLCVLSSRNLFTGQAVLAAEAGRLIRLGGTPSEIGTRLRQLVDHIHTYLVPADLFHIYKRAAKKGDSSINWGTYKLGQMLDMKPILHCNRDVTRSIAKVRGFEAGVQRLFANAARQVRAGLESPHVCISYGGDPATVPGLPGYADLAAAVQEKGAEILISMMSNTAAVNVGTGAVSLAFAAGSHTFH